LDNRIFSKEIIGKEVETITGRTVGKLEDFVIDTADGSIKYLLISASGYVVGEEHKVDDKGRMVVETDRIRFDGTKIIIN
jgi:sporulation protein YlmC with PRC-barrel domain